MLTRVAKNLLTPVRRSVHELARRHRHRELRRGLEALVADPAASLRPGGRNLARLVYGWGNEVWSAGDEYLRAVLTEALASAGAVLECGSGLTTLVLACVARRRRIEVWSLEHSSEWGERVGRELSRLNDGGLVLDVRPLRSWPEFDWYDAPRERMPSRFALVICDGPPRNTRGGRYGLVPVMRQHLGPDTVILLDDAERAGEQYVVARWMQDLRAECATLGTRKPYFRLTVREPGGGA